MGNCGCDLEVAFQKIIFYVTCVHMIVDLIRASSYPQVSR